MASVTATAAPATRATTTNPLHTPIATPAPPTDKLLPTRTLTAWLTPTRWPTSTRTPLTIDPRLQESIRSALNRLSACSPRTYKIIKQEVDEIVLDDSIPLANADMTHRTIAMSSNYLLRTDMNAGLREFNIMRMLAHETYHIREWSSDESAANRFSLAVFDDCASTVPPEDQAQLAAMRAYVEQQIK